MFTAFLDACVLLPVALATSRPALSVEDVLIAVGRAGAPRFAAEVGGALDLGAPEPTDPRTVLQPRG
jgi:hypothetical protein